MTEKLVQYQAAGGVVLDADDRVLLIERTVDGGHEIRLPKGHIDPGEMPEAAALREVCEETGYCDLELLADLGWQTTTFLLEQKRVQREERYYVMRLVSDRLQPPKFSSKREALFRNLWVGSLAEAESLLTFESEKSVVRNAQAAGAVKGAHSLITQTDRTMKKTIVFVAIGLILFAACAAPPGPAPVRQVADDTPAAGNVVAPTSEAMPPRDDPTPGATEEAVQLGGTLPARPTPVYIAPLAVPPPAGVVSETLSSPVAAADGLRVLYLDGSLHVWDVAAQTDVDLGWPTHAIDCPALASDGRTFYFTDQRGVNRIDLTAVVTPTLLVEHYIDDNNPARNRQFCVVGESGDGANLLLQARDHQWYQLGVLAPETGLLRVVESPLGPPGEPWNCPGSIAWGQGNTILMSGYSVGSCIQAPGLFKAEWGQPLIPSPVLTGTLPALTDRLPQRAGAWHLTPNADHSRVAFWFDQDYAREDGAFLAQTLTVVDGTGGNPEQLTDSIPGRNGPSVWSADGQSLYIATSEQFDVLDPQQWQIRRIGLNGTDEVVAGFDARFALLAGPERDGKLLLLLMNDQLTYGLHVLDLASGELLNGPANVAVVGWLP